jgi:hypothetical protein
MAVQKNRRRKTKEQNDESIGEWRRRSKNVGRICEKHRIILRTIDTNTQIGKKKERTTNDEGNRKWTKKRITKTANEN